MSEWWRERGKDQEGGDRGPNEGEDSKDWAAESVKDSKMMPAL